MSLIDAGIVSRNYSFSGRVQSFPPGGCSLGGSDIRVSFGNSTGSLLFCAGVDKSDSLLTLSLILCANFVFRIPSHPLPCISCIRVVCILSRNCILGSFGGLRPPMELLSGYPSFSLASRLEAVITLKFHSSLRFRFVYRSRIRC
jgi:hypothetical protein